MALTTQQIEGYIAHYAAYRELPREVMDELFASALTVALLSEAKGNVPSAIEAAQAKVDEEPKPKRTPKSKGE
jgi:hypothetical protein